jgi:hypothetical protein
MPNNQVTASGDHIMKKSATTTIRLPSNLIEWIDASAAHERRSRNSLIRIVLEDYQQAVERDKADKA